MQIWHLFYLVPTPKNEKSLLPFVSQSVFEQTNTDVAQGQRENRKHCECASNKGEWWSLQFKSKSKPNQGELSITGLFLLCLLSIPTNSPATSKEWDCVVIILLMKNPELLILFRIPWLCATLWRKTFLDQLKRARLRLVETQPIYSVHCSLVCW